MSGTMKGLSQNKDQGAPYIKALQAQIKDAEKKHMPRTVISLAQKMRQAAYRQQSIAPLLKAVDIEQGAAQDLDPLKSKDIFYVLDSISRYPWLKAQDKAVVNWFIANKYIDYYNNKRGYRSWEELPTALDPGGDSINPERWADNRYADKVLRHIKEAFASPAGLNIAASPYLMLFEYADDIRNKKLSLGGALWYEIGAGLSPSYSYNFFWDRAGKGSVRPTLIPLLEQYTAMYTATADKIYMLPLLGRLKMNNGMITQQQYEDLKAELINKYADNPLTIDLLDSHTAYLVRLGKYKEALSLVERGLKIPKLTANQKKRLEYLRNGIKGANFTLSTTGNRTTDKTFRAEFSYRCIDSATFTIYRLPAVVRLESNEEADGVKSGNKITSVKYLPKDRELTDHKDSVSIPLSHNGKYFVVIKVYNNETGEKLEYKRQFWISDMMVITSDNNFTGDGNSSQWLDAKHGIGISGLKLRSYIPINNGRKIQWKKHDHTTDKYGFVSIPHNDAWESYLQSLDTKDPLILNLRMGGDRGNTIAFNPAKRSESIYVYADRSIYRPGQKVYLYGVLYSIGYHTESARVIPDEPIELSFIDANGNEIINDTLKTDFNGVFKTELQIPEKGLKGVYGINVSSDDFDARVNIHVEEYKRPTFEVKLEVPKKSFSIGDVVTVSGKANKLSGEALSGAQVQYEVTGSRIYWWRYGFSDSHNASLLANGTVTVGTDGSFKIPATLVPIDDDRNLPDWQKEYVYYAYNVKAKVIAPNGEVQDDIANISVGAQPVILDIKMPEVINKDIPHGGLKVEAKNNNRVSVAYDVHYAVYNRTDSIKPLFQGVIKSNDSVPLPQSFYKLASGSYSLKARISLDGNKAGVRQVEKKVDFDVFSPSDSKIPAQTALWVSPESLEYDGTKPLVIYYGADTEQSQIFYYWAYAGGLITKGVWTPRQGKLNRVELPLPTGNYVPDKLSLYTYRVSENELYKKNFTFYRKQPLKHLTLVWKSFRNRLVAGQEEELSLQVLSPDNKPVSGAGVASWMTDASLELISPYYVNTPVKNIDEYNRPFYLSVNFQGSSGLSPIYPTSMAMPEAFMASDDAKLEEVMVVGYGARTQMKSTGNIRAMASPTALNADGATGGDVAPQIRSNFSENAYFRPAMTTDKQGIVTWKFKLPESLTRWKVYTMAHTSDMMTAYKVDTVEAYKKFMVQPNMPRFLRFGDDGNITTTVKNLDSQPRQGTLKLELFDIASGQILHKDSMPFVTEPDGASSYTFRVKAVPGYDRIGVRIFASSKEYSDGEQHALMQLPATMAVTESKAFTLTSGETLELDVRSLFPHKGNVPHQGTFRFQAVGNTLYFALQALPALAQPQSDNAASLAASIYANVLARYLAGSPGVKEWMAKRRATLGKAYEGSPLTRNDSVKLQTLNNTPWAQVARRESEGSEALVRYLSSVTGNENADFINKLKDLQHPDGSWSWYPGMRANDYITEYVMTLLVRLQKITGQTKSEPGISEMYRRGWKALDDIAADLMKEIKKRKDYAREQYIESTAVQYLYLLELDPTAKNDRNRPVREFFLNRLVKVATSLPLDSKAQAAIILAGNGDKRLSDQLIMSLKENLTIDKEQGAYYASLHTAGGYYWTDRRYLTHTAVIEALYMLQGNSPDIALMQQWLLGQKRTTAWQAVTATTDAVYALLLGDGGKPLETTNKLTVAIPRRSDQLEVKAEEINISMPLSDLATPLPRVRVQQSLATAQAWGAMYATYEMQVDSLRATGKELQVSKKIYVEEITGGKKTLREIKNGDKLHVGDKLITVIYLNVDRALDFVSLHDARPACMEPTEQLSSYRYGGGTGYYTEVLDADTRFFFDHLVRGEYKLEYSQKVVRSGVYSTGIATAQSAYAPEYAGHTAAGSRVQVQSTEN